MTSIPDIYNNTAYMLCIERYKLLKKSVNPDNTFISSLTDNKINTLCNNLNKIDQSDIDNTDIRNILMMSYLRPRVYKYDTECDKQLYNITRNCVLRHDDTCKILFNLRKLCSWNGISPINTKLIVT
jgi:hypothetical protein